MKQVILSSASDQFLKFGIRKISIQKLIAPIGISSKTLYKYFPDKKNLLEAVLRHLYTEQSTLLHTRSQSISPVILLYTSWKEGIAREYGVHKKFYEDLKYYYPALEAKVEKNISTHFWNQFIQIVQTGIKKGEFRRDLDPLLTLESIAILYNATVKEGKFEKFKADYSKVVHNSIATFIRGMCTPKGITLLEKHIKSIHI